MDCIDSSAKDLILQKLFTSAGLTSAIALLPLYMLFK